MACTCNGKMTQMYRPYGQDETDKKTLYKTPRLPIMTKLTPSILYAANFPRSLSTYIQTVDLAASVPFLQCPPFYDQLNENSNCNKNYNNYIYLCK